MSSRQQFLKARGEGPDIDSDPFENLGNQEENEKKKYLTLREPQGILEKELSQKKKLKIENDDEIQFKEKYKLRKPGGDNRSHGGQSIDSPSSEVQLLQRQVSIKTETHKRSHTKKEKDMREDDTDNNSLAQNHLLVKSKTLKSHFFLTNDKDLINKNVETNIDPKIIHNQLDEEDKENDKFGSGGKKKPTNTQENNQGLPQNSQQIGDKPQQTDEKQLIEGQSSSRVSQNVLRLLQTKKTDALKLNEEDNEILDLQLNLDEEPVTQGSVDPTIEVIKEKEERFIIIHTGKFRIRWDLWIILLVIYNCIQIPLEIAFQEQFQNNALDAFGYFVDVNFITDIILNFRTSYINEKTGLEVRKGKLIAQYYIKQWRFYFDLLSIIPFELLYNATNTGNENTNTTQFKIFDLLKLIRLLRLGRIITYLKFKQDMKIGFRIVQLLCMLLLIVHWVGCIWFIIIDGSDWIPPRDTNYGETDFYNLGMGEQYAIVFYYAILLLLGNEIVPTQTFQVVYAALIVLLGSITTAFIFGNMAALMAAINQKDSQFQDQFDSITNLMRAIKLPANTQREVEAYLIHIQQVPDMQQDMKTFLKLLSPSLRSTVLFHIYKSIIRKIPLFDQCSNIELRFIVNFMKTVIFLPSDEIIRQGDKGNKIYFISRGKVEIYIGPDEIEVLYFEHFKRQNSKGSLKSFKNRSIKSGDGNSSKEGKSIIEEALDQGSIHTSRKLPMINPPEDSEHSSKPTGSKNNEPKHIKDLDEGDYFGEIAVLTNLKRTATVKAKDFTTLGYMVGRNFIQAKDEFPQIYQAFKKQIKERYKDENFRFRQRMIQNVPYFKNMSEAIIQELIYLLRPTRYDPNMLIVKRGDSTDKIYFLKAGVVDVEVPLKGDKMHFDSLNTGSCFCIFSAFDEEKKQKFDFRTRTVCIVESISAKEILALQKQYLELSDELKTLLVQIENNEKTEFDFFRFVPIRSAASDKSGIERKQNIKKKFRMAIAKFFRRLKKSKPILHMLQLNKKGNDQQNREAIYNHILNNKESSDEENTDRKHFKALHALDQLEKERKDKEQKLKFLKERCSNPSFFALSALMGKKKLGQTQASNENLEEQKKIQYSQLVEEEKEDNNDNQLTQSLHDDRMSERSVEVHINKYPRIDGIRKELDKFKKEHPSSVNDGFDQSMMNNQTVIKRTKGPDGDQFHINANGGDDYSANHFFTQTMQNIETNKDITGAIIETDKSPIHDQSFNATWKFKLNLQNLQQNKKELEKDSISQKRLQFEEEGVQQLTQKKKEDKIFPRMFGDSQLNNTPDDTSRGRNDISNLNKSQKEGGEDLIQVLLQINTNLTAQQRSMDSLQTDMLKRMLNLERKLNRAIRLDNVYAQKKGSKQNYQRSSIIRGGSKQKAFKEEDKYDSVQSNDFEEFKSSSVLINKSSPKNKRLPQNTLMLNSQYAKSEFQFIKDKNQIQEQQLKNQDENDLPKVMSTPINKKIQLSGASHGIHSSQSPPQVRGDSDYSAKNLEAPHIIFNQNQDQLGAIQAQKLKFYPQNLNDQSMSQGAHATPYFMTEYLETLVDNNLPLKKILRPNENKKSSIAESDKAPTEHQEMATKGPIMNNQVHQKAPTPNYMKETFNPLQNRSNMRNNLIDQSDVIEINEHQADLNELIDNTLVFEDQLEESIERLRSDGNLRKDQFTPDYLLFSGRKKSYRDQQQQQQQQSYPSNQQLPQSYYFHNKNLNIIYLPNSIIQFQGSNDLVVDAGIQKPQQQQNFQQKPPKQTTQNNNQKINIQQNRKGSKTMKKQ